MAPTYQQELAELPDTQETAAAPVATAPETRSSQDSVIAQLRAQLAVAQTSREATKTTPGTGPGAGAGAVATTAVVPTAAAVTPAAAAVAPTATQRSAANDVLQQGENKKFVDLVQTKDAPRGG